MGKIKILVVTDNLGYGGAEIMMLNYIKEINKDVISFSFLTQADGNVNVEKQFEDLGCKIYKIIELKKVFRRRYVNILKNFLDLHSFDIVHSNLESRHSWILEASLLAGVKIRIAHSHNTCFGGNILAKAVKKYYSYSIKKYANEFFCCSLESKKLLNIKKEKFEFIHNAISFDKFKFSEDKREYYRQKYNIPLDAVVFIQIGRITKVKNQRFSINFFSYYNKRHENSYLFLVGQGSEQEVSRLKKKIKYNKKIIYINGSNDISGLLSASDICLLPSLYEGFPVVTVEAQFSGVYTLCSSNITKSIDLNLGLVKFFKLNDRKQKIADYIQLSYDRYLSIETARKSGFEIKSESAKLEQKYIELYEKYQEV